MQGSVKRRRNQVLSGIVSSTLTAKILTKSTAHNANPKQRSSEFVDKHETPINAQAWYRTWRSHPENEEDEEHQEGDTMNARHSVLRLAGALENGRVHVPRHIHRGDGTTECARFGAPRWRAHMLPPGWQERLRSQQLRAIQFHSRLSLATNLQRHQQSINPGAQTHDTNDHSHSHWHLRQN